MGLSLMQVPPTLVFRVWLGVCRVQDLRYVLGVVTRTHTRTRDAPPLPLPPPRTQDGGNTIECLNAFEDPVEKQVFDKLCAQPLSHPSVGFVDGALVDASDESQGDIKMKLKITHWCDAACVCCC